MDPIDVAELALSLPEIDPAKPSPARIYDFWLVRHEALFDRVGVGYLHRWAIAVA